MTMVFYLNKTDEVNEKKKNNVATFCRNKMNKF